MAQLTTDSILGALAVAIFAVLLGWLAWSYLPAPFGLVVVVVVTVVVLLLLLRAAP